MSREFEYLFRVKVPQSTPSLYALVDQFGKEVAVDNDRLLESAFDERKQVGVDRLCLRGGHAVRKTFVGLQRPVL
jgi:hypothetical protein